MDVDVGSVTPWHLSESIRINHAAFLLALLKGYATILKL